MKRWLSPLTLVIAVAAYADEDIDERQDADPNGTVEVLSRSGTVAVEGWDESEITVEGSLGRGTEHLSFVRDGKHTMIKVVVPGSGRDVGSTDLNIRVPRNSELSINGVSGDIDTEGVWGIQRLQTVSGDISAEVFDGDIEVKTVSGDLRVNGNNAPTLVTITVISGDTEIENIAGEVEASTVSGDLEIEASELSRARFKSTDGDIEVVGSLAGGGRFDAETVNGEVSLTITDATHLEVDAETFNGDIDNCFGEEVTRKSQYGPGRMLRFSRGDADRTVRVKTMNGDVSICDED